MKKIEIGSQVSVHYIGKFEDGSVFDSSLSEGRNPLNVVLGNGNLIKGFEVDLENNNQSWFTFGQEIECGKCHKDDIELLRLIKYFRKFCSVFYIFPLFNNFLMSTCYTS